MLLTKRITSLFLLLACFAPLGVFAQSGKGDWDKVKRLKSGTGIVLSNKQGQEFTGDVQLVSDTDISFVADPEDVGARVMRVKREDVVEISKYRSRFSRKVAGGAIGLGVGLGVGIGVGAALEERDKRRGGTDDPGLNIFIGGFLGVLFGTAFGVGLGPQVLSEKSGKIYVAP